MKTPELVVGTILIKRKRYMRFLGIMIDECITWKDHIRTAENKITKNIGILYRAKKLLNTSSLKSIYFSYILKLRKHYMGNYSKNQIENDKY